MKKLFLLTVLSSAALFPFSIPLKMKQLLGFKTKQQTIITPRVAIIQLMDPINTAIANNIFLAVKDSNIDGIILLINCNGGELGFFSVIHDVIKKATSFKPVIALIHSGGLSGGYLIASAADYILAHSGSSIGNIGAFSAVERYSNVKVKDNIVDAELKVELFRKGKFKALYSPYAKDLSPEEKSYIESCLDISYTYFKETVAENRGLDLAYSDIWAEGKIFCPTEAIKLNLIDAMGTYFEAEEKIIELISQQNPTNQYTPHIEFIHDIGNT